MMISILVTNTKGGCGKTTIATNLAAAFAAGGLCTALADVDRQKSAAHWLAARPRELAPIAGLDWRKAVGQVPAGTQRLVIDAPAGLKLKQVDDLLAEADIVLVPVQASAFDLASTRRFMSRLVELKPVRKSRAGVFLVANRSRPRTRASRRLDQALAELEHPVAGRLADRALYGELAATGQGVFDVPRRMSEGARAEWTELVRAIEGSSA
jgi:chromosome partitioning protein